MVGASFLDTGVVIGYCFYFDRHGLPSTRYITNKVKNGSLDAYRSDNVEREFQQRQSEKAQELSDEVALHRKEVQQQSLPKTIDKVAVQKILDTCLDPDWDIAPTIAKWYNRNISLPIEYGKLVKKLRALERLVESRHNRKKKDLDQMTEYHERDDSYPSIDTKLMEIHWDDRSICLDAHDVAKKNGTKLELATTNPKDLIKNGRRGLVKRETAISQVRDLSR